MSFLNQLYSTNPPLFLQPKWSSFSAKLILCHGSKVCHYWHPCSSLKHQFALFKQSVFHHGDLGGPPALEDFLASVSYETSPFSCNFLCVLFLPLKTIKQTKPTLASFHVYGIFFILSLRVDFTVHYLYFSCFVILVTVCLLNILLHNRYYFFISHSWEIKTVYFLTHKFFCNPAIYRVTKASETEIVNIFIFKFFIF